MYKKMVHFLRGSVLLQVETPYPERVWNLCGVHKIPFWDVQWLSPVTVSLRTTRMGLRRLRRVCGDETSITVKREKGAPILWRRIKRRYVLLGGFALFWIFLLLGNIFVWDFEVTGNQTVPTETILRALEDYGLTVGSLGMSIDQEDLRNHVLLELEDVSWLAVNMKGCTAHVQVVERQRPPEMVGEEEPCNVVARCSGLVTKVQALDGRAEVLPGTTVTQGQLLISGVADSNPYGVRLMHGMGEVWARTWYDLTVSIPLTSREKEQQQKTVTHAALDFGKRRLKFYGKGSVTGEDCDKIIRYKSVKLMGMRLPLTWVVERYTYYETVQQQRQVSDARQEGEAQLLRQLKEQLGADGTVSHTRFAAAQRGQVLVITLRAECEEQIGESVPLAAE